MSTLYFQVAKRGDLISLAHALYGAYRLRNEKLNILVAEEYADTLALCDYVTPVVWRGDWKNLGDAYKFAKKNFDRVISTHTHMPERGGLYSFQLQQWRNAGMLHNWDKFPLQLNRPPNAHDIVANHLGNRPTILFADKSESSPFPHADRLAELLEKEFSKTHALVRLSGIRLERMCDCIALYDASKALVVTETAHLHLSKATKTPVFALTTNTPTRWHGSAWSKHFRYYARYNQYEREEMELIEAIRRVL